MRALVTGGTGFVGANLVDGLNAAGHTARVLRRETSRLDALDGLTYEEVVGDILDYDSLIPAMEGCDWVFHAAAVSDYWRQGTARLYEVNVEGTRNVLQAAQTAGIERLVYTSSMVALGIPPFGQSMDETHEFNVSPRRFPYAHSKHLAEQEVQKAVRNGLEAIIVNPAVIIGPRDVNNISGSIGFLVARGWVRFYLPGGVNCVAVEDVVAGHIAAAERGRPGERYILGGENLPVRQVIDAVVELSGVPRPLFTLPRWIIGPAALAVAAAQRVLANRLPFDADQVRMSGHTVYVRSDKAIRELGLPQTPFRLAVERAYRWFRQNGYL